MKLNDRLVMFLATGFYAGRIPFAPGTFGSAIGLFFCYGFSWFGGIAGFLLISLLVVVAVPIARQAEEMLQAKDPGCIVIDEIAGMALTMWGLPFTAATALSGFLVFRVLDVTKPFPIRQVEHRLSGGAGIVLDDVLAGCIGNLVMRCGLMLFQ